MQLAKTLCGRSNSDLQQHKPWNLTLVTHGASVKNQTTVSPVDFSNTDLSFLVFPFLLPARSGCHNETNNKNVADCAWVPSRQMQTEYQAGNVTEGHQSVPLSPPSHGLAHLSQDTGL